MKVKAVPALAAAGVVAAALALPLVGAASGSTASAAPTTTATSNCIAHRVNYAAGENYYTPGCSGHDEPELDPVSTAPGSARDITWNAILPTDGKYQVVDTGPTFWWGGTVSDPKSLFHQAFLELQFYPDSYLLHCGTGGGFQVRPAPNTFTVCSPVWKLLKTKTGYLEPAAFNDMLRDGNTKSPLVMHAGDAISIHIYAASMTSPFVIDVFDRTTHHHGRITLISPTDGPLTPSYSVQKIGNSLGWGIVDDTPMSFVWEIGHTGNFTTPPAQFCLPGEPICDSYDAAHWAGTMPLQITSVHFGDGSRPTEWATVSDFGGAAEVARSRQCKLYGTAYCIYPWYTLNSNHAFSYGVDYPNTVNNFGQTAQFATFPECPGGFGPNTDYCDTVVLPRFGGTGS